MNIKKDKIYLNIDHNIINQKLSTPITDEDIKNFLGTTKHIIKYSELEKYNNDIDKLLPKIYSYKILLLESEINNGHWVLISKYKDKDKIIIEYFDSYGNSPLGLLKFNKSFINNMLGQKNIFINKLLENAENKKYMIIYNKKRFQKINPNISTCGRHIICRLIALKSLFYSLIEYQDYIKTNCDKLNLSPDEFVCVII
jgi:hypothetical protein